MPQILRPSARIRRRPRTRLHILAHVRRIAIAAEEIEQQVGLAVDLVVPVSGRALNVLLNDSAGAARTGPGAEQAIGADLSEDVGSGLVLDEAGVSVVAEGQERQVDDGAGRVVDVVGRGLERLEVGRVGGADLDGRRGAAVGRVRGGVELAGPVHQVLARLGVPDGLGRPDHARRRVLDLDEALARPRHQIGRFPDENAARAGALGSIPGCLQLFVSVCVLTEFSF